jgi:type II secretory pathway pseudopilin PulG
MGENLLALVIVLVLIVVIIFAYFKMQDNRRQEAELLQSMRELQNLEKQNAARARESAVYPTYLNYGYYPDLNWLGRRRLYGWPGGWRRGWHRR